VVVVVGVVGGLFSRLLRLCLRVLRVVFCCPALAGVSFALGLVSYFVFGPWFFVGLI
jgi:hypothetical protein